MPNLKKKPNLSYHSFMKFEEVTNFLSSLV